MPQKHRNKNDISFLIFIVAAYAYQQGVSLAEAKLAILFAATLPS